MTVTRYVPRRTKAPVHLGDLGRGRPVQFAEGVRLALYQLWTEKLKSFFSLLGVIVGVMFLIVVVSVVEGMDRYIREDLSSVIYGVNTVTVRRQSNDLSLEGSNTRARERRPRITYEDWQAIRDQITIPARVGAESDTGGQVVADNGRMVENVQIFAVSSEIMQIRAWVVEKGRSFSPQEAERGTAVVILGTDTAELLFEDLDPIGRRVRIRGFPYRVVGVLEEQGSLFGFSMDNRVIAPAQSPIQAVTNARGFVDQVVVQAIEADQLRALQSEVEGIMRARNRLRPSQENNFTVETADEALSFWDRISRILFLALPGLVAISLVVGGIVIMNIMLVSVMERTREIGVRKAVGARRRDILSQVLIESITLSGVGAVLGVSIGVGLTYLIAAFSPLPAAIDGKWIALGVSLGVVVGIVSGVYPASQASKLLPVDALRHE
jgi:putative ABC transport system permease protein